MKPVRALAAISLAGIVGCSAVKPECLKEYGALVLAQHDAAQFSAVPGFYIPQSQLNQAQTTYRNCSGAAATTLPDVPIPLYHYDPHQEEENPQLTPARKPRGYPITKHASDTSQHS